MSVFVVWGPLMIGGTYYALTGEVTARAIAASLPYGLLVTTVLIGKHIDKLGQDAERGVSTLPVLLGLERSLALIKLLMISFYPLTALLVMLRMLQPWALLTLLSVPRLRTVLGILSKPKPKEPPEGYRAWPAWYVAFALWLNRRAGGLLILGLALGLVVPIKL